MTQIREKIYCACCGYEVLAERVGDTIIIKDRRNRKQHVAVIDLTSLKGICDSNHQTTE